MGNLNILRVTRLAIERLDAAEGACYETVIDADLVECSFYLSQHYPATLTALTFRRIAETSRFRVRMAKSRFVVLKSSTLR